MSTLVGDKELVFLFWVICESFIDSFGYEGKLMVK